MSEKSNLRYVEIPGFTEIEGETSFLKNLRKSAYKKLCSTPFPDSSMESYRKIKFNQFNLKDYFVEEEGIHFSQEESESNFLTENELSVEFKDFVSSSYNLITNNPNPNFFTLLSLSFCKKPIFISIAKNLDTKLSITTLIQNVSPKGFPVIFLNLEKNSNLKMSDRLNFNSERDMTLFSGVFFVNQERDSFLESIHYEDFSDSVWHFRDFYFNQKSNSKSKISYYNFGGYKGKTFLNSILSEGGAETKILGAAAPVKKEFQDIEVTICHNDSHTSSSLLFHTVLKEKAHHVFTGNLIIPQTSSKVEATQVNHNLILDKSARAESMPKLEVLANDVKCSHGATMSEVDESQLFYLQTRGLDLNSARHLIVEGFLSEIIKETGSEEENMALIQKFLEKLMV